MISSEKTPNKVTIKQIKPKKQNKESSKNIIIDVQKVPGGYQLATKPIITKPKTTLKILFEKSHDPNISFNSLAKSAKKTNVFPRKESTFQEEEDNAFWIFKAEESPIIKEANSMVNEEEKEELEIVDNCNKKIKIQVSGLTGKTSLKSFENVPNTIDFITRKANFESLQFNNDFRSGYAPIEIQQIQERDFSTKDPEKKEKTQHFIRKKQSCAAINLKRTCGVSYVKQSESHQLDVNHIFETLPPLVFQCSSECDEVADITIYHDLFKKLFNNSKEKALICSVLDVEDEAIRDYLLKPQKRPELCKGRIFLVRDYHDLWPFFLDKLFIIVHFFHTKQDLITNYGVSGLNYDELMEFIKKSQFQLGILLKKNLSGKKSFIKTLGSDFNVFLESQEENQEILDFDAKIGSVSSLDDMKPNMNKVNPEIASTSDNQIKEKPKFLVSLMNKLQTFFFKKSNNPETPLAENTNSNSFSTAYSSPCKSNNRIFGVHPSIVSYLQKDPKMKNIYTISVRMELFTEEALWKSLKEEEKNQLNGLILNIDDTFQREALPMSNKRMESFESEKAMEFHESLRKISVLRKNEDLKAMNIEDLFLNVKTEKKIKEIASFGLPLYYISTRDCFAFDLLEKKTVLQLPGRPNVLKTEYFFHPKGKPQNFKSFETEFPDLRVGVTCYTNFFSHEELLALEAKTFETEIKCFKSNFFLQKNLIFLLNKNLNININIIIEHFIPMTAQATFTSEKVRRTKFFLGMRYMWSKQQIAEPFSNIAAGVRSDVSPPPQWLKSDIEGPLVKGGIIPPVF